MASVILDRETLGRFTNCHGQVEVRDEAGRLYGLFFPAASPGFPFVPPFTKEELDRAASEPGGRSLREILADWKARS